MIRKISYIKQKQKTKSIQLLTKPQMQHTYIRRQQSETHKHG